MVEKSTVSSMLRISNEVELVYTEWLSGFFALNSLQQYSFSRPYIRHEVMKLHSFFCLCESANVENGESAFLDPLNRQRVNLPFIMRIENS
jgi:hypothetical protein